VSLYGGETDIEIVVHGLLREKFGVSMSLYRRETNIEIVVQDLVEGGRCAAREGTYLRVMALLISV
jgi:hypothetical protein